MKTRVLYFAMIAAALTFSCQKAELENNDVVDNGTNNEVVDFVPGPGKILAVSPTGTETKIAFGKEVDGKYPVVWTNNDAIKVYSESNTKGVVYKYTTEATEGVSSAVFTGDPVEGETRYAVFPATRAGEMEDGKIKVDFGALYDKQNFHSTLKNNGNNLKYMPMWAKESDKGVFQFNNLCAAVMFRFNDYQELRGMKIVSVKITSANNYISGFGTVDPETGVLTLSGTDDAQKTIVVDHDKTLGPLDIANKNTNPSINDEGVAGFVTALPAMTYPANDLTVTITDNFGRVFERVVTTELVLAPGQAREFPTLSFTFCYGEANCVVITPGEDVSEVTFNITPYYTFDKSLAVDKMQPVKNASGDVYCEEGLTLDRIWGIKTAYNKLDAASVLPEFSLDGNKATIKGGKSSGNALLALKDSKGTILWSWHIWSVDCLKDQAYTSCTGTPTFHNINLGATRNQPGNQNSIGLYYQYGRKDPFVISKSSTIVTSKPYLSQIELTEVALRSSENKRMAWTIKNPNVRIISTLAHEVSTGIPSMFVFNEWLAGDSAADNWGNTSTPPTDFETLKAAKGGYKTIYDPCPEGYKVPDMYYFSGLSSASGGNGMQMKDKGIIFSIAGADLPDAFPADGKDVSDDYAFYPNPGYLNQGTVLVDGIETSKGVILFNKRGYYWTTTNFNSGAAVFSLGNSGTWANEYSSHKMSLGSANNIRCMKIQ